MHPCVPVGLHLRVCSCACVVPEAGTAGTQLLQDTAGFSLALASPPPPPSLFTQANCKRRMVRACAAYFFFSSGGGGGEGGGSHRGAKHAGEKLCWPAASGSESTVEKLETTKRGGGEKEEAIWEVEEGRSEVQDGNVR